MFRKKEKKDKSKGKPSPRGPPRVWYPAEAGEAPAEGLVVDFRSCPPRAYDVGGNYRGKVLTLKIHLGKVQVGLEDRA